MILVALGIDPVAFTTTDEKRFAPIPDVKLEDHAVISEKFSVYRNRGWADIITGTTDEVLKLF